MKKTIKNFLLLFISLLITTILSFFTFVFLGKKLSVEEYGKFNTLIALVSIVSIFVNNIASGTVINRELSLNPKIGLSLTKRFILIRIISYLVGVIFIIIYVNSKGYNDKIIMISLALLLLGEIVWELFEQVTFSYKVAIISTVLNILGSLFWFIIVILLPLSVSKLYYFLPLYAVIVLIKGFLYFSVSVKKVILNIEVCVIDYSKIIKMSFPFLWIRILGTISSQLPTILLGGYVSDSEAAFYSAGEKFTMPISLMINAIVKSTFPYLTKYYNEDKVKFNKFLSILIVNIIIIGSFIALLLTSTSQYWIVLILGEKYRNSIVPFNYQMWYIICVSFDTLISLVFTTSYKQRTLSIITTIDVILYIPALIIGINYGAEGIAIGKLIIAAICVSYHLIVTYYVLDKHMKKIDLFFAILYLATLFITSIYINVLFYKLIILLFSTLLILFYPNSVFYDSIKLLKKKISILKRKTNV